MEPPIAFSPERGCSDYKYSTGLRFALNHLASRAIRRYLRRIRRYLAWGPLFTRTP